MNNKTSLLKLVVEALKPEIIVESQLYSDKEQLYKLTEAEAEAVINTICQTNNIPYKDFVGLYEDVIDIVKKRIIIN